MIHALTLIAFAVLPFDERCGIVVDEASTLEFETYYDDEGREVFLQLLVWELTDEGEEIKAWRLWKTDHRPTRNVDGTFTLIWIDGEVTRRITAKKFIESHRQRDTEMYRRNFTPKDKRSGLYTPRIEAQQGEGS